MISYPAEPDLVAALDRCDGLVRLCAAGRLPFEEFCARYDNIHWSHAQDGHESDAVGLATLAKYAGRISPHRVVAETILAKVCRDEDFATDGCRSADRFGPAEAVAPLELVAAGLTGGAG